MHSNSGNKLVSYFSEIVHKHLSAKTVNIQDSMIDALIKQAIKSTNIMIDSDEKSSEGLIIAYKTFQTSIINSIGGLMDLDSLNEMSHELFEVAINEILTKLGTLNGKPFFINTSYLGEKTIPLEHHSSNVVDIFSLKRNFVVFSNEVDTSEEINITRELTMDTVASILNKLCSYPIDKDCMASIAKVHSNKGFVSGSDIDIILDNEDSVPSELFSNEDDSISLLECLEKGCFINTFDKRVFDAQEDFLFILRSHAAFSNTENFLSFNDRSIIDINPIGVRNSNLYVFCQSKDLLDDDFYNTPFSIRFNPLNKTKHHIKLDNDFNFFIYGPFSLRFEADYISLQVTEELIPIETEQKAIITEINDLGLNYLVDQYEGLSFSEAADEILKSSGMDIRRELYRLDILIKEKDTVLSSLQKTYEQGIGIKNAA